VNGEGPAQWRLILRQNFTHWEKLATFLELTEKQRQQVLVETRFPLNLPMRLARKMAKGTLDDPLLRQFLPTLHERQSTPGFVVDPVGDVQACTTSKLLQKYQGRALLVCTSACAMHCRYCFRQNFSYDGADKSFDQELAAIAEDDTLEEIILSGGDPLSLSDERLQQLLQNLSAIPHIQRIRFHTRFPIGIPERIDANFLMLLKAVPKQLYFVIHSNHPLELDEEVLEHLNRLKKLGVLLMNQSVLLKGVNDEINTLKQLCERLVNNGILPYYLYQLDRVQGSAHFEVGEEVGQGLIRSLAMQLPGYAVPRYVREIAGEPAKTPL
jgi:EF-P beta-lysylation protein EpmB